MHTTDSSERLMRSLSVLAPHLQRLPLAEEIPSQLTLGTARILMELTTAGVELAVGELSNRLRLPLPRVSKLLGDLEDAGLIKRVRDASDRRRVSVRVLPAGTRAADGLRRGHSQRLEQLVAVLGPKDTEQLLRIFERAAKRLSPAPKRRSASCAQAKVQS